MEALVVGLIIAASSIGPWLPVITAFGSGTLVTAIYKFFKLRPERDSIVASATKQAVDVFESAIQQLQDDLKEAQKEAAKLSVELAECRRQLLALQADLARSEAERRRLAKLLGQ